METGQAVHWPLERAYTTQHTVRPSSKLFARKHKPLVAAHPHVDNRTLLAALRGTWKVMTYWSAFKNKRPVRHLESYITSIVLDAVNSKQ